MDPTNDPNDQYADIDVPMGDYGHASLAAIGALDDLKFQNIGGKRHPTEDSLVDRSHRNSTDRGLVLIGGDSTLLQMPSPTNGERAIVKYVAKYADPNGNILSFSGHGAADPTNCSAMVAKHLVEMAETRARARAQAVAMNIKEAVAEEMAEGGGVAAPQQAQAHTQAAAAGHSAPTGAPGAHIPPGKPAWWYNVPGKKDDPSQPHVGKRLDDPTVPLETISYWAGKGFFSKNPASNAYDIPDPERTAMWRAELAHRQGAQSQSMTPTPPSPAQAALATNAPVPAVPQAPTVSATGWRASSQQLTALMKLGQSQTPPMAYPQVKALALANFGKENPLEMDNAEFNMLRALLGATDEVA